MLSRRTVFVSGTLVYFADNVNRCRLYSLRGGKLCLVGGQALKVLLSAVALSLRACHGLPRK